MSGSYAFMPYGISTWITATIATSTLSLTVALSGGTSTLTTTSGNYAPSGCRIANNGTAAVSLMFSTTDTTAITLTGSNGMLLPGNTWETFWIRGFTTLQTLSQGTTTLSLTLGEGL